MPNALDQSLISCESALIQNPLLSSLARQVPRRIQRADTGLSLRCVLFIDKLIFYQKILLINIFGAGHVDYIENTYVDDQHSISCDFYNGYCFKS